MKTAENCQTIAVHRFGNIVVTEKTVLWKNVLWRYTVSGNGDKFILAILSNTTGHLLALPLAEEFRDTYTTIALSVPPVKSFLETAEGLKLLLDCEGIRICNAIGHSNGGVYLQNLIAHYPGLIDKVVFSHSLTSMDKNDAYTTNASEVKMYRFMRKMLKALPASVLTFVLGQMVFPKLHLKSGKADTQRLINLCREDMKRISRQNFIITADCMEDFLFNHTFTSEPYTSAPQKVLIIDSSSDTVANPMQRAQMLKLCPGAREYHFENGGHLTMLNNRDEYFSLLKDFWK
ncbi:MAG: alpha/beta hydrolase [Dysgonamonadaceae bacterium]|jgi:pimeloyl-ACP methyl ester carboxylesterase|nr:alpha/beta hydrolase [Dysgonamonadaceae bacterium]